MNAASRSNAPPLEQIERLRADKWLWAARFFKTRSLAAEAIRKHRVRIDGQKIKASRALQVGDRVTIEKPPFRQEVIVRALTEQRGPAVQAARLYSETATSVALRERTAEQLRERRLARVAAAAPGRPTRQQRRQIIRFRKHAASEPDD